MRALLSICAAGVVLIASLGSAWAGSTLLSGTVTCDPGGGGRFDLTGGSFSVNANGTLNFKMTGLPPNLTYGCVLGCGQTLVASLPGCGATNGAGKTAISLPAFFPPATFCPQATFLIEFVGGGLLCISGFGTNAAADED